MIKKAKVIACLYAGIVAANAMDENVIEKEPPDGNEKVRHSEVLGKQESSVGSDKFRFNAQSKKVRNVRRLTDLEQQLVDLSETDPFKIAF